MFSMFKDNPAFSSFSVDNLERAKKFYSETLGLEVQDQEEGFDLLLHGGAHVSVYLSTDYTAPEHTVINFIVEDIEKAVDELKHKGIHIEQFNKPNLKTDENGIFRGESGPKAIAWFKDPAGHFLAVMQE